MTTQPAGIFTGTFWRYAGERAVKTAMQTAIASISVDALLTGLDWQTMAALVLGAAATSIATSLNATSPGPTVDVPPAESVSIPGVLRDTLDTAPLPPVVRDQVQRTINVGTESVDEFVRRMGWKP